MRTLLLSLTALLALSACGNKGELYLRDPVAPPPLTAEEQAVAKAAAQAEAAQSPPPRPETRRERRQRERAERSDD